MYNTKIKNKKLLSPIKNLCLMTIFHINFQLKYIIGLAISVFSPLNNVINLKANT
jgi:hypothetical protein